MRIEGIAIRNARAFVDDNHRNLRAPIGGLFAAALYNNEIIVGVVIVGRPVARLIDDKRTVEITRLAVLPQIPNGCSKLYSWARRESHRRGYRRIVTYTRQDEPGTSLRASGWIVHHKVRAQQWSRRRRPRDQVDTIGKLCWIPAADVGLWTRAIKTNKR